jgi:hypothetical protein
MNTITKTASTTTILAIDLGKYKCAACVHDRATGEYRFTTFDTASAELATKTSWWTCPDGPRNHLR